MQLPVLATDDDLAQPVAPAAPLPTAPVGEPPAAEIPASTSTTIAGATLPALAAAQLQAGEPASTALVARTGEKTNARFSGAAVANATPAAIPGEKTLDAPGEWASPTADTPPHAKTPAARPRVPETGRGSHVEKPHMRAESAAQSHVSAASADVDRAPLRIEQPVAAEIARADTPVAPASTLNVSTAPAAAFTTPHVSQYTAPQPPSATAHIETPFAHTGWAEQFRDKVIWLVDRQQQTAELHIHPPHLGPIEVMLALSDDKTTIAFVSPHPAVREAIEASFNDLRTTLEERGLNLGQATVSAGAKDARDQLPQNAQPGHRLPGGLATAEESQSPRVLVQRGLVDTFA
jgi:flagellar hook-length control protein FliK